MSIFYNVDKAIIAGFYTFWFKRVTVYFRLSLLTTLTVIQRMLLLDILTLTDSLS